MQKYFHHDVYLVHRIDRPVSGLVLFAKNTRSAAWLSELFRSKELDKTYLAIVENEPPHTSGSLVSRIIEKKQG
ncbi:MAG: RNA pseudouridine synthase [Candidatus Parvibacillus calidus]|nr:MAG: RNA pseudouridine synthase [Candidatus Parvibacillus calidus]